MSLKRISLRDFVIVRELELDLDQGFSVLTGETGAGKSILIDALQLVLGARAESSVIREGALRCESAPSSITRLTWTPGWMRQGLNQPRACCCDGSSTPRAKAAPGSTAVPPPPPNCVKLAMPWWTSMVNTLGKV
jgi:energy-coupling factor transporter ATP-binding protein EcfA2